MFRKIMIGDKETDFKCSAATSILYKRLFGRSLTDDRGKLAAVSQKATAINRKLLALREDSEDNQNEIIELLASDSSITEMASMTQEIVPQMAYIMWLEGKKPQRELFRELTDDGFVLWLSGFDPNDLINSASEFFELWNGTNKTNSNLKNV